jgi:hypothetical protein
MMKMRARQPRRRIAESTATWSSMFHEPHAFGRKGAGQARLPNYRDVALTAPVLKNGGATPSLKAGAAGPDDAYRWRGAADCVGRRVSPSDAGRPRDPIRGASLPPVPSPPGGTGGRIARARNGQSCCCTPATPSPSFRWERRTPNANAAAPRCDA